MNRYSISRGMRRNLEPGTRKPLSWPLSKQRMIVCWLTLQIIAASPVVNTVFMRSTIPYGRMARLMSGVCDIQSAKMPPTGIILDPPLPFTVRSTQAGPDLVGRHRRTLLGTAGMRDGTCVSDAERRTDLPSEDRGSSADIYRTSWRVVDRPVRFQPGGHSPQTPYLGVDR